MKRKIQKTLKHALCYVLALGMVAGSVLPAKAAESSTTLIAKYDFEDVSGTTVPNEANGVNGFHGTLKGNNVSIEANTVLGKSLKFTDGTEGHMLIENIVNTGTTSYSMSMWYKYDTSFSRGNKKTVLFQQSGSGRTLLTLTAENKYHTYVDASDVYSDNAVETGEWQHVTYVYDSANQKAKFYINGVLDSEKSAGTNEVNALTNLLIGRHKNGGSDPLSMRGLVDEICIYEGIVTDAEAMAIYKEKADLVHKQEPEETPDESVIQITVDPTSVERALDDSVFGINHRYAFNGYGSFDSYLMEVKDDFKELYEEAGFGSIRYPGGTISNLFNWKATLDSVGRKNQIHGFYNNPGQGGIAPNFGIKEIADFADDVNSEIVYVYSLGRGSVQDAQDLIEFLNAEVGTNPNGGIDWAAVRAENGHPQPYNVRYFEIGNEMQQAGEGGDGTWSQGYWLTGVSSGAETAYINGGTASYTKQYAVCEEDWNQQASKSDGSANMVRYMRYANTNPKEYDENGNIVDDQDFAAIEKDGVAVFVGNTQWTLVDSFENSKASDKHAVIDYSTGAIHFGDGVKGAIPASGQQIYVSYKVKRDGFVQVSQAMKETTAAINAANEAKGVDSVQEAYVYSSYETQGFITKMNNGGYNDLYDGLTIHPYSGTPNGTGATFYDSAMSLAESAGVGKVQEYVNMLPEGKVPVISEYGIFRSTDALVRSQTHAIYIAKVLMEYVRLGSPYIQKHCLIDWYSAGADSLGPTQQAVIQAVAQSGASTLTGEGEFKFFSTPSAHVFQMFNSSFGDEVVASSFSRMENLSNGVDAYSALASKDAYDNYYVAVVNVDRVNAKRMELKVNGVDFDGKDVEIQLLASDSFTDENTLENPNNVAVETTSFVNEGSTVAFEIPKHAVMVVKVSAGVDKTALEEVIAETKDLNEADYTTASWAAANVAAVLADAEAVLADANASKEAVKSAAAALENAVAALEMKGADKTALRKVLADAAKLNSENYTGESWNALQVVYSAAQSVEAKGNASQELIDKVTADLNSAIKALKQVIPVSEMTATAGDSQSGEGPDKAIDENTSTMWHTDWYVGPNHDNHWLQIELADDYEVNGFQYLPRQSGGNGIITGYEIHVSEDGSTWDKVAEGTWAANASWKTVEFDAVVARYVKLVTTAAQSDQALKFASAAEIRLTGAKILTSTEPYKVCEVFSDVEHGAWYEAAVQFAYDNGIMSGSNGLFNPTGNITRAQVVATLYKLEGSPEVTDFKAVDELVDVAAGEWYTNAVCWAYNTGVTTGNKTTKMFNMSSPVTRQQLASFFYSYAELKGFDTETRADIAGMAGADHVAEYALDTMQWAVGTGLITGSKSTVNGVEVSDLKPTGTATRAQVAAIIQRFCENNSL